MNASRGFLAALGAGALGVLVLSRSTASTLHIPIGGARGPLVATSLGPSETAMRLSSEEIADDRATFYFREIVGPTIHFDAPLVSDGPWDLAVRADTTVRTRFEIAQGNERVGESYVPVGRWQVTPLATGLRSNAGFDINIDDAPLVKRAETDAFRRYVDEFVVSAPAGFRLSWASRLWGGVVFAAFVVAFGFLWGPLAQVLVAFAGAGILTALFADDPLALALALPRLVLFAAIGAVLSWVLSQKVRNDRRASIVIALLAAGMVLCYGYWSFLPNHSPADLDIHIWRTLDLAAVPPTLSGWFTYGSHYPTPSQIRGSATETLGSGPAIPYSPVPYLFFYGLHVLGLDLHWAMNALCALSLALLLPLVFAFARAAIAAPEAPIVATLLSSLDLATVHHLGRSHAPAVLGGALGVGGLLIFGLTLSRWMKDESARLPFAASLVLACGALGYSSTPVFYALFGVALIAILSIDPSTRFLFRAALVSLVVGGALALLLFYGYYIPGLAFGRSQSAVFDDPYPGRTFFIFHNESRQSLRLWRLGLGVPLLIAIPGLVLLWRRTQPFLRSMLFAWCAAWAGIMVLKEPWALPLLLRWAKEDLYVAPALSLAAGLGFSTLKEPWLRRALLLVIVLAALFLRLRDYAYHADTRLFLS